MEYYYLGIKRLSFGFGNPNIAACFFVGLAIFSWIFAFVFKNKTYSFYGFIFSIIVFTGVSICVLHTYSRGGILALGLSFIFVVFFIIKQNQGLNIKIILLTIFTLSLISYSFKIKASQRLIYGHSQSSISINNLKNDKSIINRWQIYKNVPQMIIDSWWAGWGNFSTVENDKSAAKAYEQFYQPINQFTTHKHLISTHFTWLVEWGFVKRILYVLTWSIVFCLTFPFFMKKKLPDYFIVLFATLMSFFICSFFSHCGANLINWILPISSVLLACFWRIKNADFITLKQIFLIILSPIVFFILTFSIAKMLEKDNFLKISKSKNAIIVGDKSKAKDIILYKPSCDKLGFYGKTLRKSKISATIILLEKNNKKVHQAKSKIIACEIPIYLNYPKSDIILINSPEPSKEQKNKLLNNFSEIIIIWGDFYQSDDKYFWEQFSQRNHKKVYFHITKGQSEFISNWVKYIQKDSF